MYSLAGTMMAHQGPEDIQVGFFVVFKLLLCPYNHHTLLKGSKGHTKCFPCWQVPFRYGFGGKRKSDKISLKASLCLAAGQALHLGHPRGFNTIQNVTSILFAASRLPGPLTGLANQLGLSQR